VAEQLGVGRLLNADDMLLLSVPDKLNVMTFVYQLRAQLLTAADLPTSLVHTQHDTTLVHSPTIASQRTFSTVVPQHYTVATTSCGAAASPVATTTQTSSTTDWMSKLCPLTATERQAVDARHAASLHVPRHTHTQSTARQTALGTTDSQSSRDPDMHLPWGTERTQYMAYHTHGKQQSRALTPGTSNTQSSRTPHSAAVKQLALACVGAEQATISSVDTTDSTTSAASAASVLMTRQQLLNPFDSEDSEDSEVTALRGKSLTGDVTARQHKLSATLTNDKACSDDATDKQKLSPTLTAPATHSNNSNELQTAQSCDEPLSSSSLMRQQLAGDSNSSHGSGGALSTHAAVGAGCHDVRLVNSSLPGSRDTVLGCHDVVTDGGPGGRRQVPMSRRQELRERARLLLQQAAASRTTTSPQQASCPTSSDSDCSRTPALVSKSDEARQRQQRERARRLIAESRAAAAAETSSTCPNVTRVITVHSRQPLTMLPAAAAAGEMCGWDYTPQRHNLNRRLTTTGLDAESESESNWCLQDESRTSYTELEMEVLERSLTRLDERAAAVEWSLRRVMDSHSDETHRDETVEPRLVSAAEQRLVYEWFALVDERGEMVRRIEQLNAVAHEQDLERRFELLSVELRRLINSQAERSAQNNSETESETVDSAEERERLLLAELMSIVQQRDAIVQKIDEQEQEEQLLSTGAKSAAGVDARKTSRHDPTCSLQ